MAALAFFEEVDERSDRRSSARQVLRLTTAASLAVDMNVLALIHDISAEGLLMETTADMPTGTRFEIELPEADATIATVVWKRGEYFGCEFEAPLRKATLSAVMLKNPALAPQPAKTDEVAETASEPSAAELPRGTQLWIILGLSAAAWILVASLLML
jgi:hypothetical protein